MYKIEKGIEIPRRPSKYPFRDMEVGDSFMFLMSEYGRISGSASTHRKRYGTKWVVRVDSGGYGRCWRVE